LTNLLVDSKPSQPTMPADETDDADHVELSYANRTISFEFAALNYRAPDQNRYRYKLDGFDREWTEVDATHRDATYTNLDPGSYVFHVTGSNADGVWNAVGRAIIVTVTPPWWATLWFRFVSLVLFATTAVVVYVWRERTLSRQRRELEVLVHERTLALEEALATRDVFLRVLANDLKAPIISLAWYINGLLGRMREDRLDAETLDSTLQMMSDGANDAIAAVDELHDLTRLAAGETVPLQVELVDLVWLTRSRVDLRRETSHRRWDFECSEAALVVEADRARLGRVLDNLLDNAAKYSPFEQPIEVRVGRTRAEGGDWAEVEVHDHGIGIPALDLPRVFERYHRGANVESIPGEGLGLSTAHQLIALHDGTLSVKSEMGRGTTFTVRLLLHTGAHQSPTPSVPASGAAVA
jgi:signal transduction histidine kinase